MKIKVKTANLAPALAMVSKFVPKKASNLILSGILLNASVNQLTLSATDLEQGIRLTVPANCDGQETFLAPVTLAGLVDRRDADDLELSVEGRKLTLHAGRGKSTLQLMDPSSYPEQPKSTADPVKFSMLTSDLLRALERTLPVLLPNDSRPFLSGVNLSAKGGELRIVGTDINRLAVVTSKTDCEGINLIVPGRLLKEVKGFVGEFHQTEFTVGDRIVEISSPVGTIYTRLIQGTFPEWEQVLPTSLPVAVEVDRGELNRAVTRAGLVDISVRLRVTPDTLTIEARSDSNQHSEEIEATTKFKGESFEIGFNAKYLLDFLKAAEGDDVTLQFSGTRSPALLTAPKDKDFRYVLMPVILGSAV